MNFFCFFLQLTGHPSHPNIHIGKNDLDILNTEIRPPNSFDYTL